MCVRVVCTLLMLIFAQGSATQAQDSEPFDAPWLQSPRQVASNAALRAQASAASGSEQASAWGTELTFYGWSPNSKYVAYTRTRREKNKGAGDVQVKVRNRHRRVSKGRFSGYGERLHPSPAEYAKAHDYQQVVPKRTQLGPNHYKFAAPEGNYEVIIHVQERIEWEVRFDGQQLAREVFDTPYLGFEPRLYPSPDRNHICVIMHLDKGWLQDGAIYPLKLPSFVKAQWRHTQSVSK